MILDATAGNRQMWKKKDSDNIIYLDSQLRLQVPPTLFANNEQTPFKDGTFDTIFYDPPHRWNWEGSYYSFPNVEEAKEIWGDKTGVITYYGWDVYKTRQELIRHLIKAQSEFYRILKDDGLLWLKWNELEIKLMNILGIFSLWDELMRLYVESPLQRKKDVQTFWVCLEKKSGKIVKTSLFEFETDKQLAIPVLQRSKLLGSQTKLGFGSTPRRESG